MQSTKKIKKSKKNRKYIKQKQNGIKDKKAFAGKTKHTMLTKANTKNQTNTQYKVKNIKN